MNKINVNFTAHVGLLTHHSGSCNVDILGNSLKILYNFLYFSLTTSMSAGKGNPN